MPIYEYKCNSCHNIFSVLQKVGSTEKDTACTACGSSNVKKKMSTFSQSSAGGFAPSPSFSGSGGGGG